MKIICLIFLIGLLLACNSSSNGIAATDSAYKTTVPRIAVIDAEEYTGSLPCADCDGIDISLQLNKNETYTMISVYKGSDVDSSNKSFKDNGTWSMHGDDTLYLTNASQSTKYIKTGADLIQLDGSGNKITGPLAGKFILHKK